MQKKRVSPLLFVSLRKMKLEELGRFLWGSDRCQQKREELAIAGRVRD